MSNNSDHIRSAISRLGFFTGDIGEHQFIARLLNLAASGNGIDATASAEAFDALSGEVDLAQDSTLEVLMGALIGMTDGGTFINNFITAVSDFLAGTDDPTFNEVLVEAIKGDPENGNRLFTVTSEVVHGTGTEFCNSVKLSSILGTTDFNSNFEAPTKEKPNISLIQFHSPALNFANRSSGLAGIFFNLLPTIEISKCQPFVDIKLLTKTPQIETTTSGNRIGDGISLLRFLKGKTSVEEGDPWPEALPIGLSMPTQPKLDENGNPMFDENGQPITENKPATVAGMEVFTSPQTLVNGNEPHYDIGPERLTPVGRQASVIDKFRPFLTLKTFDIKVVPARGMISTKSASISLTLHDRSRLAEIGQLVRPDGISDVEIMAEYGWSHPEGFGTRNDFATLLNALRVKEKFQVVNSSMSFNDVGEVDITLQLVSKGNNDLTFRMVTDAEVAQTFDQVSLLFRKIREIKRSIRSDLVENEEMIGSQVMGKANSISAILSMGADEMKELQNTINAIQSNPNQTEEYSSLANTMQEAIVGAKSLDGLIQDAMAEKATRMKNGVDPYAKGCAHLGINYVAVSGEPSGFRLKNHVSFAKLATEYIAKPLAATKKFEEVQLCFYPFNQFATFARDDDVGSFPINISVFEKTLAEKLKKNPAMTLAAFVGFMNSTFFNNMASDIYGFGSLYERDPSTGKSKLRKKYQESKTAKTKIPSEKKAVFEAAYGPGAEQKFTKPSVQMYLETVPGTDTDNGGEDATILRIHFFDQSATSYTGFAEMWDSLRSSLASSINMAAVSAFRSRESPPNAEPSQVANLSHYSTLFSQQMSLLAKLDILEGVDANGNSVPIDQLSPAFDEVAGLETSPETIDEVQAATNIQYVRIKGGPAGLKYMFHRNMPSIKYGSTYSAVIKANLATQNDARMATIHMQRAQGPGNGPDGGTDDGLPLRTFPGQLSMDIYGCPLINFGQQYFIDFGTGTTLDDVYAVTGVDHKFTPGSFVTSIKFVPLQKFGSYQSLLGNFSKIIAEVQSLGSDSSTES